LETRQINKGKSSHHQPAKMEGKNRIRNTAQKVIQANARKMIHPGAGISIQGLP
jgi:hypothetical protein